MTTANRFSTLFKEQVKSPYKDCPSLGKLDSPLCQEQSQEQKLDFQSENIFRKSAKKTPTKIMLGHRSYEDDLYEKEKLARSFIKSKMCFSLNKNETCQNGTNCRFAHSLEELNVSNCLFEQRCRFVRMSNGKLVNNGEKVCAHKHPHETKETFISRTGLDRYKGVTPCVTPSVTPCATPSVEQKTQHQVDQSFRSQPTTQTTFWQEPLTQPSVDQECQTNKVAEMLNDTTSDQIFVIRVPKELATQALEIAIKSGKSRIQIEIVKL